MPTSPVAAARGLEDRADERGRGRLAVRSRHARHLEAFTRAPEELVGRDRHRRADVLDDELWHGDVDRSRDDERHGASTDGFGGQVVTVRPAAADAEEERARRHATRVVCEVADLDRSAPDHVLRRHRADQRVELHRGERLVDRLGDPLRRCDEPSSAAQTWQTVEERERESR